jgi:hypothetical protein
MGDAGISEEIVGCVKRTNRTVPSMYGGVFRTRYGSGVFHTPYGSEISIIANV